MHLIINDKYRLILFTFCLMSYKECGDISKMEPV